MTRWPASCVLHPRAPTPRARPILSPAAQAFSEYPRCAPVDTPWNDTTSCVHTKREDFTVMGYSVRTDEWRATFWMHWLGDKLVGDFSRKPAAVELYSHAGDKESDFDAFENENVAAANPDVVAKHLAIARAHWEKK